MTKNKLIIILIIILFIVLGIISFKNNFSSFIFRPTDTNITKGINFLDIEKKGMENFIKDSINQDVDPVIILMKDLTVPWDIAFLPDQRMLVTERNGNLSVISPSYKTKIPVEGVEHTGEGGLLGMALHPEFENNFYIYLYLTTKKNNSLINRVERYTYDMNENTINDKTIIIDNIPGASYHDGGRIAFGPDNKLYITTGDAGNPDSAQDINSLSGKILRINDDGSLPEDNPFKNEVYSYGHRNPQGLAWDSKGNLWSTEHGPSGIQTGKDEVNLIIAGGNYGWPAITGNETAQGMISPVIQSGEDETWAPSGMEIIDDKLFFAGLRGEAIYSADIAGNKLENLKINFHKDFGRIRFIKQSSTNFIYIGTSNQDGRGKVNDGDDKIIRIDLNVIK